jgi:spoIIIJ-associated protein
VRVDSQGFRSQRVASLERLAREAAEEVRRRGRPKTLHSMNPSDRRTVHMALKDTEGIVTESSGEGFYKRITVRPA